MIKFLLVALVCLVVLHSSCTSQQDKNKNNMLNAPSDAGKGKTPTGTTRASPSAYELHGIIDPGINNMVAFALQTPRGWNMQQSFTRIWNRSTPINQIYIKLVSPGSENIVEFLPSASYFYTDGPMARNMRQMAASYGTAAPRIQGELAPMAPGDYLKRVSLPQLAQRGLHMQMTGQKTLPSFNRGPNVVSYNAYVDGTMNNGMKVRVDCVINLTTTQVNSETYYNWDALTSVTQSKTNLETAYAAVTHGRKSVVFNPAWSRQIQQLNTNGNIANNEIDRKNAAIAKDYSDYTNKVITETYNERSKSQDRNNEAFSDMIRGDAKYENTETGERMKLSDSYNHIYQDRQGNNYGSNTPVDAGQFNWTELQRVETKNY
jgi:hypothetical protein